MEPPSQVGIVFGEWPIVETSPRSITTSSTGTARPVWHSPLVAPRGTILLGFTLLVCLGAWLGNGWATSRHDDQREPPPTALVSRAERLAGEQRTVALERRVAALEAALSTSRATRDTAARSPASLRSEFGRLQAALPGDVGVAFGSPGGRVIVLGTLTTGPAWSTMKVPLAIAFVRRAGASPASVRRAITLSDNPAAMTLWNELGASTATRVARVQEVMTDAGDRVTRVQGQVVRAGFTPFGQTTWSLQAQQAFAARLPCIRAAAPVLTLMGQIDPSQRWGLGRVGTHPIFKGGWGPSPAGAYLVRQFGLIRVRSGTVAVAIAAQPADGSFATGALYLDRLARWVAAHARGGRPAACR